VTTSHFLLMILYAFFVSLVFAVLLKDQPREQMKSGAQMFGAFIVVAYLLGWLIYPFPF
jgi:undecaprenyl pyrophosphate phosphatase UppP